MGDETIEAAARAMYRHARAWLDANLGMGGLAWEETAELVKEHWRGTALVAQGVFRPAVPYCKCGDGFTASSLCATCAMLDRKDELRAARKEAVADAIKALEAMVPATRELQMQVAACIAVVSVLA